MRTNPLRRRRTVTGRGYYNGGMKRTDSKPIATRALILAAIAAIVLFAGTSAWKAVLAEHGWWPAWLGPSPLQTTWSLSYEDIPSYEGSLWVELNGNVPSFAPDQITSAAFEQYSPLDELGRAGAALACLGMETVPAGEREDISSIRPSGWQGGKYDFIERGFLYNRCHLIAFSLAGENANEQNLITGTQALNIEAMPVFEGEVLGYLYRTKNHVMYRVTPVFVGDELLCRGVQMEAYSVEDAGAGICFNVYCFNVQPGVEIDYATGRNWPAGTN